VSYFCWYCNKYEKYGTFACSYTKKGDLSNFGENEVCAVYDKFQMGSYVYISELDLNLLVVDRCGTKDRIDIWIGKPSTGTLGPNCGNCNKKPQSGEIVTVFKA